MSKSMLQRNIFESHQSTSNSSCSQSRLEVFTRGFVHPEPTFASLKIIDEEILVNIPTDGRCSTYHIHNVSRKGWLKYDQGAH